MKAVKEVNMSEIKGRKVAVDLCLPQKQYIAHVKAEKSKTYDGKTSKIFIRLLNGIHKFAMCIHELCAY